MPKTVYSTSNNTRTTCDLKFPTKNDGTKDNRYSMQQFITSTGKRDMRTTLTKNR